MIAGDDGHLGGRAQRFQQGAAVHEFLRQRDIGEVAGDRDVVGLLRLQVGDDLAQHLGVVDEAAIALPVDIAGDPLADQLGDARRRQRRQMRVGEMGEGERHELPIKIPAMNTSTPPTTTWNAACRNGVSMYFVRIQEIAASSTATTHPDTTVAVRKCGMR